VTREQAFAWTLAHLIARIYPAQARTLSFARPLRGPCAAFAGVARLLACRLARAVIRYFTMAGILLTLST
jgi:hypothetical protein